MVSVRECKPEADVPYSQEEEKKAEKYFPPKKKDGQTMEKKLRLRSNQDFKRVYAKGRSYRNRNFILIVKPNALKNPRIGFSITKKTGNSVTRNLLKRRLREIVRLNRNRLTKPMDMIVIPRKNTIELKYSQLESSLLHVIGLALQGKKKK